MWWLICLSLGCLALDVWLTYYVCRVVEQNTTVPKPSLSTKPNEQPSRRHDISIRSELSSGPCPTCGHCSTKPTTSLVVMRSKVER